MERVECDARGLLCPFSLVSVRWKSDCCVHVHAWLKRTSDRSFASVSRAKAHCLFRPCTHARSRLLFIHPLVGFLTLQCHNPEKGLVDYDPQYPFAGCEPNTTAGPEDFGGDFDLAGAAGRAARTGSVFGGSDQEAASTQFPPPWPGLGMGPLGPTFRA